MPLLRVSHPYPLRRMPPRATFERLDWVSTVSDVELPEVAAGEFHEAFEHEGKALSVRDGGLWTELDGGVAALERFLAIRGRHTYNAVVHRETRHLGIHFSRTPLYAAPQGHVRESGGEPPHPKKLGRVREDGHYRAVESVRSFFAQDLALVGGKLMGRVPALPALAERGFPRPSGWDAVDLPADAPLMLDAASRFDRFGGRKRIRFDEVVDSHRPHLDASMRAAMDLFDAGQLRNTGFELDLNAAAHATVDTFLLTARYSAPPGETVHPSFASCIDEARSLMVWAELGALGREDAEWVHDVAARLCEAYDEAGARRIASGEVYPGSSYGPFQRLSRLAILAKAPIEESDLEAFASVPAL